MNEQLQKEVFQRLDALAEKLGVVSGNLWEVLVRQAYAEALLGFFYVAVSGAALYALYWYGAYVAQKAKEGYWDDEGLAWFMFALVATFGGGGAIVIGFNALESIVFGFANPEYVALSKILKAMGGTK